MGWGLSEEAGKAARWLSAFGLPGTEIMLAHLQQLDGNDYDLYQPSSLNGVWQAHGDYLCPIITGAGPG